MMDAWTQFSPRGAESRKNSYSSLSGRHHHNNNNNNGVANGYHQIHAQHGHSPGRLSGLRPLQPVTFDLQGESGQQQQQQHHPNHLALSALHIQAIRVPTSGPADGDAATFGASSSSDDSLSGLGDRARRGVHAHDEHSGLRAGEDGEPGKSRGAEGEAAEDDDVVGSGEDRSSVSGGRRSRTLTLGGQKPMRTTGPDAPSARLAGSAWGEPPEPPSASLFAREDRAALLPHRGGFRAGAAAAVTRATSELVITQGHFVARRPPPPASRSKSDVTARRDCTKAPGQKRDGDSSGSGSGAACGLPPRRGNSAGERKHCGRPCDACSLQQFHSWVKNKQLANHEQQPERMYIMDNGRWLKLGENGQPEMPLTTVTTPAAKGLPKLTGLKHEFIDPDYYEKHRAVAEMQTYEHMKQRQQKTLARTDPRAVPVVRRQAAVIKKRDMIEHLKKGNEIMEARQQAIAPDVCVDLMTDILHYNVPGVNRMQRDYTALLDNDPFRPAIDNSRSEIEPSIYFDSTTLDFNQSAPRSSIETTVPMLHQRRGQRITLPGLVGEQKS